MADPENSVEPSTPPPAEWFSDGITNSCWRCCFSREFIYRFLTLDAWNPLTGLKWNVAKLRSQLLTDIWLSAVIFFASEIMIAVQAQYWRPVKWSVYWIFICVVCSIIGTFGAVKRSTGAIVVYVVLMLMFSSINLAHVNQMRGEMVRTCNLAQISFKNCNPTHNSQYAAILNTCINTDSCTKDQLDQTNCKAPGSKHCSDVSQTEAIFWVNAIVNFLTYAEPVWFAVLLLLRMEISGDTAPNPPQDEDERPNPGMPTVFKCQDPPEEAGAPEEASTPLLGNPNATASHTTPRDE